MPKSNVEASSLRALQIKHDFGSPDFFARIAVGPRNDVWATKRKPRHSDALSDQPIEIEPKTALKANALAWSRHNALPKLLAQIC
jgi:hypothetical protein